MVDNWKYIETILSSQSVSANMQFRYMMRYARQLEEVGEVFQ
jgi:hypothetical protein